MKRTGYMAIVLLLVACSAVCAGPYVTATYQPWNGGYRLDFTVCVPGSEYGYGTAWGLSATGFTELWAPSGWVAKMDFRQTKWESLSSGYDVPPDGMLTGCAAATPYLPAQLDYYVRTTVAPGGHYGTLVPTPIPEPSSLLSLLCGLGLAGSLAWRNRWCSTR